VHSAGNTSDRNVFAVIGCVAGAARPLSVLGNRGKYRMRLRQTDHRPPILARTITLGRWSGPNVAELIVIATMTALVIMVWSYVV
jgi:hypothetical protein